MEQERSAENRVVGLCSAVFEIVGEGIAFAWNAKPLNVLRGSQPPKVWGERKFPIGPVADLPEILSLLFFVSAGIAGPVVEVDRCGIPLQVVIGSCAAEQEHSAIAAKEL